MHFLAWIVLLTFPFQLKATYADAPPSPDADLTSLVPEYIPFHKVHMALSRKDPGHVGLCKDWCRQIWITELRHSPQTEHECFGRLCANQRSSPVPFDISLAAFENEQTLVQTVSQNNCNQRKVGGILAMTC